MNLIFKIVAIATLTLAASVADAPTGDEPLAGPSGTCCTDYCGTDKNCVYWCEHDPGGPCPR